MLNRRKSYSILTFVLLLLASLPTMSVSAQQKGSKRALMWFDAEANFKRLSNPDSIDYYLNKVKAMGFTDAVVDVRPITGEVLFDTPYAPKMKEWFGCTRPDFDYLGRFISTAHRLGMNVHASLNVFVAGHNYYDRGLIYSSHPEWASTVYTSEGMKPITALKKQYSAMVNPINKEFQKHILNVLCDLVKKYPQLDGLILDRVRYDGIATDFSDLSRTTFEKYIHEKVEHFPTDIFKWQKNDNDNESHVVRGKYFKKWIEWRTKNIYDFMARARKAVKAVNPKISFGTYTGAWYPSYYEVGVNFASSKYDPSKDFDWATADYHKYGYAELLDLYTTGNYYTDLTIAEAQANQQGIRNETDSETQQGEWYSVEGSCKELKKIMKGHAIIGGTLVDQFYPHPERLSQSIATNLKLSEGIMLFDICHIIHQNLWKEVENGMRQGGMLK